MAILPKLSIFLRRLGEAFLLAFLLDTAILLVNQDIAGILFVPTWIAFFFVWPYLRKHNFNVPRTPRPRAKRSTAWGRVVVTGWIAFGVACGIVLLPIPEIFSLTGPLIWIALYYGWPALSRCLPLPERWKVKAQSDISSPAPKLGFWRLLGRGALAMLSVLMALILFPAMFVMAPVGHSMERARRVHDSIHAGMTVQEVLDKAKDCDVFGAESEFPYDEKADSDNIPAMHLSWNRDGTYRTYDLAAHQDVSMTETQAVERLHSKLHDGYQWRFSYTYINITPMHVSFSVIFGPDGLVSEVTPVHGWD